MTNPSTYTRAWRAANEFVEDLKSHNAFEAAASIAFWFFLSLLPLLVLLGFLVSLVARSRGVDTLLSPLLDVVPDTAEEIIRKELDRMSGNNGTVAPLGIVGFLWTASSGLHNLMDVFEAAARVERRSWYKQRAIAIGWVLLGLATACLAAWLLVKVDAAVHRNDVPPSSGTSSTASPVFSSSPPWAGSQSSPSSGRSAPDRTVSHSGTLSRGRGALKRRLNKALHTPTEQLFATMVVLALGMVLLAGFYRFAVEHPPGVRRRVWPGTFAAVGSWLAVSWVFGLYAVSMSSYALYYGSLAAVAVMMVWLYITSLSLVIGANVNARIERGGADATG